MGGAARASEHLAQAMGFDDVESLTRDGARIAEELRQGVMLTAADLGRALLATEFVFISDHYGAGWDWARISGFTDEETIRWLREIQLKLAGVARLP